MSRFIWMPWVFEASICSGVFLSSLPLNSVCAPISPRLRYVRDFLQQTNQTTGYAQTRMQQITINQTTLEIEPVSQSKKNRQGRGPSQVNHIKTLGWLLSFLPLGMRSVARSGTTPAKALSVEGKMNASQHKHTHTHGTAEHKMGTKWNINKT